MTIYFLLLHYHLHVTKASDSIGKPTQPKPVPAGATVNIRSTNSKSLGQYLSEGQSTSGRVSCYWLFVSPLDPKRQRHCQQPLTAWWITSQQQKLRAETSCYPSWDPEWCSSAPGARRWLLAAAGHARSETETVLATRALPALWMHRRPAAHPSPSSFTSECAYNKHIIAGHDSY